jgi:hypothetical protein
MFKRIKHGTTVMVQSMKKGAGPPFLDPQFEVASAHFKEVRDQLGVFHEDSAVLLAILPRLLKQITEFVVALQKCYETLPPECRDPGTALTPFLEKFPKSVQDQLTTATDETVLEHLTKLIAPLDQLGNLHKEQHDNFLILESNRAKLETLQKDPQKNALEITRFTEKVTVRTQEVQRLEAEFISMVSATWGHRLAVITPPLKALLAFVAAFGAQLLEETAPVRNLLGPELLATDFPLAEPPQPKK